MADFRPTGMPETGISVRQDADAPYSPGMPAPDRIDWYDTPQFYDIIFDEDTGKEADFLESVHRLHGGRGKKRVLELACGSGRLLAEMARRGWTASGFDLNEAMLEFARDRLGREGLRARLWRDRMESFTVPRAGSFDLVHCLVSTFKYLLTEKDAVASLQLVAEALRPGGLFVLGLHLTDPATRRITHERWVASRDGVEVVCNTRTWPPPAGTRIERMRNRLKVRLPSGEVHHQETRWEVRSYSARQVKSLLRKVPSLSLVSCHDFRHDPEERRRLDDEYSDLVMVLRRND